MLRKGSNRGCGHTWWGLRFVFGWARVTERVLQKQTGLLNSDRAVMPHFHMNERDKTIADIEPNLNAWGPWDGSVELATRPRGTVENSSSKPKRENGAKGLYVVIIKVKLNFLLAKSQEKRDTLNTQMCFKLKNAFILW